MRTRRLAAAAAAALVLVPASSGFAATSGSQTVTFTLVGGALSITAPTAAVDLGSAATGSNTSLSAPLGSTTVTDNRGGSNVAWTVNISSTDWTSGSNTISRDNVRAYSGLSTRNSLTGLASETLPLNPVGLSGTGGRLISLSAIFGSVTTTYNPTVVLDVPDSAIAGTYTGTVTQTVS